MGGAITPEEPGLRAPAPGRSWTRARREWGTLRFPPFLPTAGVLALFAFGCSGCSPVYVAKAGWTEAKILMGRRPISEVLEDPETDEGTRHKLLITRQARAFAIHFLELDAGDSYTTFTRVEDEVLAWIISAAYPHRLESKTWWFPIVGRVPYRGYASRESAEEAERELAEDGFDTYLRPTSAFSTLGWFSDPLLSTLLTYDDVELVTTVIHELSHNHLWVPGHTRFNESYATFVGRVGAVQFFCGPREPPGDPENCQKARARWAEYQAFSSFLDVFVDELQVIYGRADLPREEKVQAREDLLKRHRERVESAQDPDPDGRLVRNFVGAPLNNAILMARMRYFHRLPAFQALLEAHEGDLSETIATLRNRVRRVGDPFQVLPSPAEPRGTLPPEVAERSRAHSPPVPPRPQPSSHPVEMGPHSQ